MSHARAWTPIALPAGYAPAVGAFSPATEAAGLVFVSGQVPCDPVTGQWEKDRPLEEQIRRTFSNLAITLGAAGLALTDIVSITIYLADIGHWGVVNQAYKELFAPPYPARAIVGAALEGFLIEVSAVAARRTGP